MANNFRLTGNVYVSKDGSDANSGLTPDLPKLTVQAGLTLLTTGQTLVIGSGHYYEPTLNKTVPNTSTYYIIADGYVVLEGSIHNSISFNVNVPNPTISINIYNITFKNIGNLICSLSCTTASNFTINYFDCLFINTNFNCSSSAVTSGGPAIQAFTRCVIVNGSFQSTTFSGASSGAYFNYFSSILLNCRYGITIGTAAVGIGVVNFNNSYADSYTVLYIYFGSGVANFNFNNIQGKIMMNTGTYSGIALSYADHRTYYPTFNVNSMSVAPQFNDVQNLNFTLASSSPHIRAASDYISNIGGTEYAVYKAATDAVFSGGTISNLTLNGNAYTITAGTSGYVITTPIPVQSYPATKPLTGILLHGDLQFNKSITAPAQGNQNVPAYDTYTSGAGASPDRLKIKMRYSTQSASPTAGQWDNGGYVAVDAYFLVEVNVKPKVDSNGVGNGDYTYLEFTGLGDLVPTWIQLDIKLRNDYAI